MSRSTTEFFFEPNAESLFQRVCFSQRAFPGPALNLYVSETSSSPHRDWKNQGMERDKAPPPPPPVARAPSFFERHLVFIPPAANAEGTPPPLPPRKRGFASTGALPGVAIW